MKRTVAGGWVLVMAVTMAAGCGGKQEAGPDRLPEGETGIASRYPGDEGIGGDGTVVFADGFEGFGEEGPGRWHRAWRDGGIVRGTETAENVHGGKTSLEVTLLRKNLKEQDSCGVDKYLEKGWDQLFIRYYAKFAGDMEVLHGGGHNGVSLNGRAAGMAEASPGIRADGRNKMTALLDMYRHSEESASPGKMVVYVYHPEQRGKFGEQWFPSGRVEGKKGPQGKEMFGGDFTAREELVPELGRWYCFELMVKANEPGKRDGRIAVWVDGKLRADFPNRRLRDVEELKLTRAVITLSTLRQDVNKPVTMWFDDVVVARSYIGPMREKAGSITERRERGSAAGETGK